MRRITPVVALVLLFVTMQCERSPRLAGSVSIGFAPSLTSSLEIIAQHEGFFAAEGVDAEMVTVSTGRLAMDQMLAGKLAMVSSATFPFVTNSFLRDDIRIVATTAICGNDNQIVARKSAGIASVRDLRGKRVGVAKGSTTQYVLDLLLVEQGLGTGDISQVDAAAEELLGLLAEGKLDAVCTLGIWVEKAREQLGDDAVVFTDETLMRITTVLSANKTWIDQHPDLLAKVLKAYLRAEEFVRENPDASFDIVTEYLGHSRDSARKLWQPRMFKVTLDQSLLVDLEGLARWQIAKGLTKAGAIPNYLNRIHFATLEKLAPDRVKIVH